MYKKLIILLSAFAFVGLLSATTLTLTWNQPTGYSSTLYSATNIDGTWTEFSESSPPVDVDTTNQVSFFKVDVFPTNASDYYNSTLIYTNEVGGPNAQGQIPQRIHEPSLTYFIGGNIWTWDTNDFTWK